VTAPGDPGAAPLAGAGPGARVAEAIRAANAAGRAALVVYLPAGYPDMGASQRCLTAAAEAGADVLEVGFPYSDPLMDGPVIQAACQTALQAGYTPADDLAMCRELTAALAVPALVMTYYNLVWHYPGSSAAATSPDGLTAFARDAAEAGLAGAIVADLPAAESGPWRDAAAAHGLATVFLAAPSSRDATLAAVAANSTGFVYATSVMGVTGTRASLGGQAAPLVARLRANAGDTPVCVGIGVSTREQAAEVAAFADGVIVGSAAVRAAGEGPEAVGRLVADLAAGCREGGS
jgi:tryptophan synthase alpha chain